MPWYKVVIDSGDQVAKDKAGTGLIEAFRRRYEEFLGQTTGVPQGFDVYHKKDELDNHLFYVSPVAFSIGEQLLRSYKTTACSEEPNLEGFTKVPI